MLVEDRDSSDASGLSLRGPLFYAVTGVVALGLAAASIPVDATLSSWMRNWDIPGDLAKLINFSEVFAHGLGVSAILGAIWWLSNNRSLVGVAILITATSGIVSNGMKALFVRVRPHSVPLVSVESALTSADELAETRVDQEGRELVAPSFWDARQRSFPSGHSATAVGLAIGLTLIWRQGWWIFAIYALLASLQRLTSGAHFPSDVLAGWCIALGCAACYLALPPIRRIVQSS